MGMTPLAGLAMTSRSGDVDPGALLHLSESLGMPLAEVDRLLNQRSGMMGLCGHE